VYSEETPIAPQPLAYDDGAFRCVCPGGMNGMNDCEHKHRVEGSVAFVPSVFGMTMASVAVKLLVGLPLPRSCEAPAAPRETLRPSRSVVTDRA
jgi:tRNA threonylcarbamoyladenosine dehydratase